MESGETSNVLQTCRICLRTGELNFFNLFNELESPNSLFYADIIHLCTSIKFVVETDLPSIICSECARKAKELLEFRRLCEISEYNLRKLLVQTTTNINEDIPGEKSENNFEKTGSDDYKKCTKYTPELEEQHSVAARNEESHNDTVLDLVNFDHSTCNICGKQYKSIALFKKHNCKKVSHECAICKKSFAFKHSLKAHIDRIHGIVPRYECDDCGKVFNARSNLARHKLIHSGKKPHHCEECPAAFIQKVQLQDHVRRHHTFEKPYACSKCDKRYSAAYDLKHHLESHVKNAADIIEDNKAICGICNEEFSSETKLKLHKTAHLPSHHLCSECGKRFATKRGLQSHQELHKDKKITCDTCHKTFATNRQLLVHNKSHGPKKYLCNTCGNKYATKHGLNLHMAVHSDDRPFLCNIEGCAKTFRSKNSLRFHTISHTGEKKYSCNECGKKFAQSGHLFNHKRFHSGVRPYKCTVCHKTFAMKNHFHLHMRRHTGNKEFICPICSQAFYDSSSLSKHKKKLHAETT